MSLQTSLQTAVTFALAELDDLLQDFAVRRTTRGDYDPVEDEYTTTTADYACRGVFVSLSGRHGLGELLGSTVLAGDKAAVVAGESLAVRPAPGDELIHGLAVWRILAVDAVEPGSAPLLYRLHIRQGSE